MIFFDTEDNSEEVSSDWQKRCVEMFQIERKKKPTLRELARLSCLKNLSEVGFAKREKRVTQIAAIDDRGKEFYAGGKSVDSQKFLNYLRKRSNDSKSRVVVYAHNLQYDLGNLFHDALDVLDVTLVGGRMIKAIWGNIEFRDTFNMWPMSAKALGKAFQLAKLKRDVSSKAYVLRDVQIIRKAMLFSKRIGAEFEIEHLPATLGGFCVKIWRSMGGNNWHDSEDFHRSGFYGGRTELFSNGGKGHILYCDINSLYPSVMLNKFPEPVCATDDLMEFGMSEVTIEIPECRIAPLPVRRDDDSIYYPWGGVRGVWTNHEIRNAVQYGAKIIKLHKSTGTANGSAYYAEFMREMYCRRLLAKTGAEKLMFKLLMNNLYGHLGMSGEIIRSLNITEIDRQLGFCDGVPYGRKKLTTQKIPLPETTNYLHAAYITSFARLELQRYLRLVDSRDLIYCDTDSILFFHDPAKPVPFSISANLGEMKLEAKADYCETFAPKVYNFGGEFKAKGVKKSKAKEFVTTGQASFFAPFKFRESVRFFDAGNAKPLSIWREVTKRLITKYDKKAFKGGYYFPLHHKV